MLDVERNEIKVYEKIIVRKVGYLQRLNQVYVQIIIQRTRKPMNVHPNDERHFTVISVLQCLILCH